MAKTYFGNTFPFAAVVGQDRIKKSLMLNLINPRIGGTLISGEKGTGKSTLVRGLAELTDDMEVVNVPLNITEDRLVGSIDLEKAIHNGKKILDQGLPKKAEGNFLYIDEINLLSEHIVNILLEVASTGINYIEREGLSEKHDSNFVLIGTMNPEEGLLRSQFLDRFGHYVEATGIEAIEARVEVMERRLSFEKNIDVFCSKWDKANRTIEESIKVGRERINQITIPNEVMRHSSLLVSEGKCSGHRGELAMVETGKAIAALNGCVQVSIDHINEATELCLPHRIREGIDISPDSDPEMKDYEEGEDNASEEIYENMDTFQEESVIGDKLCEVENYLDENRFDEGGESPKTKEKNQPISGIEPISEPVKLELIFDRKFEVEGSGKRTKVKTNSRQGRCIKYKHPKGIVKDIAFDATLRIAAGKQFFRPDSGLALKIKNEELREKVREKHVGASILFLVDASGSMGAKKRMSSVKGVVMSMLNDVYQKRDKVGIITFRRYEAEVILDITRSVDLAEKHLKILATGGKTPLALGLFKAFELLKTEKIKNPDTLQYLVVISDGKGNVPLYTNNGLEDALVIGEKIRFEGIKSMILDTENGYIQYKYAEKLAEIMDSKYIKMDKISQGEIEKNVQLLAR